MNLKIIMLNKKEGIKEYLLSSGFYIKLEKFIIIINERNQGGHCEWGRSERDGHKGKISKRSEEAFGEDGYIVEFMGLYIGQNL